MIGPVGYSGPDNGTSVPESDAMITLYDCALLSLDVYSDGNELEVEVTGFFSVPTGHRRVGLLGSHSMRRLARALLRHPVSSARVLCAP